MKMFRWGFAVPAVLVIVLIGVFFTFYLDTYIKKAFIAGGELVFGAKVEIGSLKTKFAGLSVNIRDIKIGDKDNEFKNLADIDSVKFGARFIPLLSKKIIIDNMNVEGIKWGTSRTVSCKLPPKKQKKVKPEEESFASKAMKEVKVKAVEEYNAFPSVQKFGEIQKMIGDFTPQSIVDMAGIKSVTEVQNSYVNLMGKYDSYSKTIGSIDVNAQITSISALYESVSKASLKTPSDIKNLKDNIEKLNDEKKLLEKTYADLKVVKDGLLNDAKQQKDAFKNISSLINQDVENISSKLSIPSLDFKNISRMLFGEVWVSRVDTVLYYMSLVRKYMPETKAEDENKPKPKERMKGRDISYPVRNKLPKLFIANITVSGTSGGEGKEGVPVSFSGNVKNITSDQKISGKITTFEVKGDDTNQTFNMSGSFNRLAGIAEDIISVSMDGIDAARLGIPDSDYTPSFRDAKTKLSAEFSLIGSDFITKAGVYINGIFYDSSSKDFKGVSPDITKYVNILWQGIDSMNLEAKLAILKDDGFKSEFASDIDKQIGQRFNSIMTAAIGDVKAKIKKEVTQYVDSQKNVLQAEADKYSKQIQKEIDPKLQDVQKQIDSAKKLITQKENDLKKQAVSSLLPSSQKKEQQ